ncbi:MAG: molybdopterin-dependent oxidoreductase [Deferrisomatales bacterium]|nr:molybdopterin-dependent oxidoreductase [Deferrisomatales bacterium]
MPARPPVVPRGEHSVIRSACRMCHGVCQVLVHVENGRVVKVTGDPECPTSRGYLCPKGAASAELLYHPDRLTHPLKRVGRRGENRWERLSWDEAVEWMVSEFTAIRQESGSEYLGMVQGTGRPYSGFVARFAHAFGTPNITEPLEFCYLPRQQAARYSCGQLPVADVYGFGGEAPRCVLLWGCNITQTGGADGMCGGMVQRALRNADQVIVVDPRCTKPAESAQHWLQLRPGTDGALALAMIHAVIEEDLFDRDFVRHHCVGWDELVTHVRPFTPEWAGAITRLEPETIRAAARTYATTKPACLQWGNAIDMSPCAFQTARSLLILSAITGNIDRPGGDALWVAPPPVARRSPWHTPVLAGAEFLPPEKGERSIDADRFPLFPGVQQPSFWRSILTGEPYRMRAVWLMGANVLVTSTHSLEIERALHALEFSVVSELFMTPTAQLADLVLPAASWLETEDVASLHKIWCVLARPKVAQLGETRDDREVIFEVARRLGLTHAFPWPSYRAHLNWTLEETGLDFEQFCEKGILTAEQRYFKYRDEGFATPSKKFELLAEPLTDLGVSPLPVYREPPLTPVSAPEVAKEYPLILTGSGRIKEFFHSEGRQVESLRRRHPDPLLEIHPETATGLGIQDGEWVWVETREGRITMKASFFDGIAPDVVGAEHAWWFPEDAPPDYGWKRSSLNLLFGDAAYDPDTGSESLRSALCRVRPTEGGRRPPG